MRKQQLLDGSIAEQSNPNDEVYTPPEVAKKILQIFKPKGRVLEPCRGKGAFTSLMPTMEWCEIKEGKDFFDYTLRVDWIVTNPPYSTFNSFMDHSFELADNVVFLAPIAKIFKSWQVIEKIRSYGGIKTIWFIPANRCGFPFGFPAGAFHFKRGYKGSISVLYYDDVNSKESE